MTLEQNMGEEDGFQRIIQIMRQTPPVQPPDNLTERVMMRLSTRPRDLCWRIWEFLSCRREADTLRALAGAPILRDCSFYFLLAGVYHLMVGTVLMAGFNRIGEGILWGQWILIQPQISFTMAFGFMAFGILLLGGHHLLIKAAILGIYVYMGFVIMNGIALQVLRHSPVAILVNFYFAAGGLFVGVLLATVIQRYLKNIRLGKAA